MQGNTLRVYTPRGFIDAPIFHPNMGVDLPGVGFRANQIGLTMWADAGDSGSAAFHGGAAVGTLSGNSAVGITLFSRVENYW